MLFFIIPTIAVVIVGIVLVLALARPKKCPSCGERSLRTETNEGDETGQNEYYGWGIWLIQYNERTTTKAICDKCGYSKIIKVKERILYG